VRAAAAAALRALAEAPGRGSVLCFLPGGGEARPPGVAHLGPVCRRPTDGHGRLAVDTVRAGPHADGRMCCSRCRLGLLLKQHP